MTYFVDLLLKMRDIFATILSYIGADVEFIKGAF